MTEIRGSQPASGQPSPKSANDDLVRRARYRFETVFQLSSDPLFVLSRRRLVFVNQAFETLSGLPAARAVGMLCSRRSPVAPDLESAVARALAPPPEVLRGSYARSTRVVPTLSSALRTWEIEYFPLHAGSKNSPDETLSSLVTHVAGEPFSAVSSPPGDKINLLCILGKITVTRGEIPAKTPPLPDKLLALRERVFQRYRLDRLQSQVPAMERVAHQISLACKTNVPILITGEPGTGKQWLARTIHSQGTGRAGPFIPLDCERLPEALVSSFLTADNGILHRAGAGTLYLREPSRLPRDVQQIIRDWLEETEKTKFRVIAGINSDPSEEMRAGRLLPDFHALLGTIVIQVPALRDRLADLDRLIESMFERLNDAESSHSRTVSPEAKALLTGYSWPGNLRELFDVLASACRHAAGDRIGPEDLPAYLRLIARLDQTVSPSVERSLPLDQILAQVEQRLIKLALRLAKGNKSRAADLLAIPRPRLWRRLDQSE